MLLFVVLFWRLGQPRFWDPDEAHYAETTREWLRGRDWATPYYNEQPFFDKPIFFHWFQAVPMAVLGSTELAARVVPALAALALVGATTWLAREITSDDVATVGGLLLAASPGVFALARYAILDTLFTAFLFGGAAAVTVAALRDRPRLQWAGYVLIALATLVKGPLALALCGLTFVLAIAVSAEARRRLLSLHWIAGLAVVLAIAAPWFVYMWRRWDGAFVDGYVLNENVRLFATQIYARQPNWWFYFRILAAGLLPWTGLLIGRLWDDVRRAIRRDRVDAFEVLLWCWTVAVVGFFSFSRFRLDHYVFPAAPALCLLCARAYTEVRVWPLDPEHAGARTGLHLVGPLLVAVGTGVGYFLLVRLELSRVAIIVPIVMTIAGAYITIATNLWHRGYPRVPWIAVTTIVIAYVGVLLWVIPAIDQRKVAPDLGHWIAVHATPAHRVAAYRLNRWPAFRFYADRHTDALETVEQARAFFNSPEPFYCAMQASSYDEFVAQGVRLRVAYMREGMWATSGRVLWRRRIPATQFVVVTGIDEVGPTTP